MNRNNAGVLVFALILAMLPPASAQAPAAPHQLSSPRLIRRGDFMNRNNAGVLVFALILAMLPPASAQAPAAPQAPPPSTPSSAPPPDAQPPMRAQHDASGDADARHCLELATNNEVIACAEKYRSNKARK